MDKLAINEGVCLKHCFRVTTMLSNGEDKCRPGVFESTKTSVLACAWRRLYHMKLALVEKLTKRKADWSQMPVKYQGPAYHGLYRLGRSWENRDSGCMLTFQPIWSHYSSGSRIHSGPAWLSYQSSACALTTDKGSKRSGGHILLILPCLWYT